MASGDRIELLTAGAFENAMSTVAQESTVSGVATKINEIDANVDAVNNTLSGMLQTVNSDHGIDTNTYNMLADLYNNRVGVTNNTGGTSAAGTMMAKLNTIINNLSTITSKPQLNAVNPSKLYMSTKSSYSGTQTVINISGSGALYDLIASYTSNITITIDGKVAFRASYTGANSNRIGVVQIEHISAYNNSWQTVFSGSLYCNGTYSAGTYTEIAGTTADYRVMPLIAPLRFTSSLVVTLQSIGTSSDYGYAYILD